MMVKVIEFFNIMMVVQQNSFSRNKLNFDLFLVYWYLLPYSADAGWQQLATAPSESYDHKGKYTCNHSGFHFQYSI